MLPRPGELTTISKGKLMTLLHYHNLGVNRPDIQLKQTFFGLKIFSGFLERTKRYMESDDAVKRLAWSPGVAPINGDPVIDTDPVGFWVQLTEPADRPNEPESTFKAFLDENIREIYEISADTEDQEETKKQSKRERKFDRKNSIKVLDRDPETIQLLLERKPGAGNLLLQPNTLTLKRQLDALRSLQSTPLKAQLPLLRLFESADHARWPVPESKEIDDEEWKVLTDVDRPGTSEQRNFVEVALATPDFAFLEGPPGSGKTTAICELVLQSVLRGKRILLCASTHVAVDNVLERLMDERNLHRDLMIPVRIGERSNVSQKARSWQLENFVRTERERILRELKGVKKALTESQKALLNTIQNEPSIIERMVLDASNLVCGTTIGILQHPDIKSGGLTTPIFDMLIIDEASKTTFQEFLVPGLLAKRWVIVGDPKQLSPFVDDVAMSTNIETCLPDKFVRDACTDIFYAGQASAGRRRIAAVALDSEKGQQAYIAQAQARGVDLAKAGTIDVSTAAVVIGSVEELEHHADHLPLDVCTVRAPDDRLFTLRRRAHAWLNLNKRKSEDLPDWATEISWRLTTQYEQRFANENQSSTSERLRKQVDKLLPHSTTGIDPDKVMADIDRVRRVALPSILESLRYGFERNSGQKQGTALTDGLPDYVISLRHVLLKTQHRMHGDIAAFSHEHIYEGEALFTPADMEASRAWTYGQYKRRGIWLEVQGGFKGKSNSNPGEARVIIQELEHFEKWTKNNPRRDGLPWEVAILTFYRGQEREVRDHLRKWTCSGDMRHFSRGSRQQHIVIELCTVDRFQGHEADLVFISLASSHPTSFLESPNRLNVALTRARYQRVVVGDRKAMLRGKDSALNIFAKNEPWEQHISKERK